ncbi:MAG: septum formation initiator family protein [Candidatus Paceibacterota bacterium]
MLQLNRKNKYNFWHSPIALIVLFCLLILFIYNIIGLIEKHKETAKKKNLILANIETLRRREDILNKDIEKLKTEEGVEEMIREKYQVVKEGEKMVVIVDENEKVLNQTKDVVVDNSFWGWVRRTFKR